MKFWQNVWCLNLVFTFSRQIWLLRNKSLVPIVLFVHFSEMIYRHKQLLLTRYTTGSFRGLKDTSKGMLHFHIHVPPSDCCSVVFVQFSSSPVLPGPFSTVQSKYSQNIGRIYCWPGHHDWGVNVVQPTMEHKDSVQAF